MSKLKTITYMASLSAVIASTTGCSTHSAQFGKDPIDKVIQAMTVEEKAAFVVGTNRVLETPPDHPKSVKQYPLIHEKYVEEARKQGITINNQNMDSFAATYQTQGNIVGAAGQHYDIPRLGIPAFVYADGPAGLRIDPTRKDDAQTYYCTAFPTETALAATWDLNLVERTTKAMGEEVKEYGVDVLLAPAINIHRSPLCGRNFEYFSEDPFLVGQMATAYINGVQSNGVGVSLKHFAVNDQETHRNGINAVVSMRAMREIYLRGFEMAVKASQPWTIMSSYNKINGVFASENRWLLTDILRNEWGYKGFVMTDWWAQENGVKQQLAGNDLIMPGTERQLQEIIDGVNNGSLPREVIDTNIRRILEVMQQAPTAQHYQYSNKPDLDAHAKVTREVATEGMVLLKNEPVASKTSSFGSQQAEKALPLAQGKTVALFGNACYDILVGGSGSGNVNRKYKVSLEEGMKNAGFKVEDKIAKMYNEYLQEEKAKVPAENFWTIPVFQEPILSDSQIHNSLVDADVAIITICRMAGEGGDRKAVAGDYLPSDAEAINVVNICRIAHAQGKPAIILLNMGNIIDMKTLLAAGPDAILHTWLGGQEAGNSIADVLSGKANPSGKLPMTWANDYNDFASSKNFPYSEGDSIVRYEEDIYVGYRQFDRDDIKPLYPFGYGLSYTTFEYSDLNVVAATSDDQYIKATVTVRNTGNVAGKEVVQLYVSAPATADFPKPNKELKAFAKTRLLQPNESQTIELIVSRADLASWNPTLNKWQITGGQYTISAATNANDIKLSKSVTISK